MRYLIAVLLFSLSFFVSVAQHSAEKDIVAILEKQTVAWNEGNIEGFMQTYWNSDSLMFVGKSGVVYGYDNTLNNYKKSYPDTAGMGKLRFDILQVKKLSPEYYFVVGKWHLTRTAGNLQGHYTLLFRKIKGQWKIVSDHSS